ncbi:MAG TPA: cupredoxin domain-containing protein [Ilumatobacteraceae bacterium]|nr:cupredoxin domain-containing protein [Ilumatobacteraceae bacterium]
MHTRQRLIARLALAALPIAGVALAGCSTNASAGAVPVYQVRLGRYTIEPAELTLPAGRFQLVVTNVDSELPHSLVLLKRSTQPLAPGQSQTLTVKSGHEPSVGDYVMFCDIPGHRQMGQQGIVHVVDPATLPTTATGA